MSQQIKKLESELDVALFDRNGKRISLTAAGIYLKSEVAGLLDHAQRLERNVKLMWNSSAMNIRIGYGGALLISILPEYLAHLKKQLPELSFELIELPTDDQVFHLLSGKIDIGFARSWINSQKVNFVGLGEEGLSLVFPRGWFVNRPAPKSLEPFAAKPYIALSRPHWSTFMDQVMQICLAAGFTPTTGYKSDQFLSIFQMIHAGLGWSILPTPLVENVPNRGLGIIELSSSLPYGIAYRKGKLPKLLSRIIKLTIFYFQKFAPK